MSLFLPKSASALNQPWTVTWKPGVSLANFLALYDFDSHADANGDLAVSGATNITTTLDGPIQVAKFRNLTVNSTLGASQRCRGLFLAVAGNLNVGAAGVISMSALGAAGSSKWANKDIFVPQSITFTGKNTSYAQFLAWIRSTGYCIFDPNLYAAPLPGMGDVQCDWATWTPLGSVIISAAGCGAGVSSACTYSAGAGGAAGGAGAAGTNAPGGGGSGAFYTTSGGATSIGCSGPGRVWGGGPGGGGVVGPYVSSQASDIYGGPGGAGAGSNGGGGAGNPPGAGAGSGATGSTGTGGILITVVLGSVTLTAGHVISANGMAGGAAGLSGGGGSGGGKAALYYVGTLTGTPNVTATGGAGGTSAAAAGAGGAGATEVATLATKGW